MSLPQKPQVAIVDGKLAFFMGGAYQFLTLEKADVFIREAQSARAKLQRQIKRDKRAAAKEVAA